MPEFFEQTNPSEEFEKKVKDPREFTDEDLMNPSINFEKYKGRDPQIGKVEAKKRKEAFNQLLEISNNFIKKNNIDSVDLLIKGSVAVDMCTPESDLDVVVLVKSGHKFIRNPNLFYAYKKRLESALKLDFEIQVTLIIEGVYDTNAILMGDSGLEPDDFIDKEE